MSPPKESRPKDKASHAYGNLRTKRTETQFGEKGHAYIYLIYGMYYCFNATVGAVEGKPEAVLLRGLEPLEGVELMMTRRPAAKGKPEKLANGPSKLCMAMGLSKRHNGVDLTQPPLYLKAGESVPADCIVEAPRIGVDYADEWKHMPWRFYIRDNACVSVKAK